MWSEISHNVQIKYYDNDLELYTYVFIEHFEINLFLTPGEDNYFILY